MGRHAARSSGWLTHRRPTGTRKRAGAARRLLATISAVTLTTTALVLVGAATAQAATITATVSATRAWTDSGVDVSRSVTLEAIGTINVGGPEDPLGPAGSTTGCVAGPGRYSGQWVFNGPPCWSLIGKVTENGEPFKVGTGGTFSVPRGRLYLGVDDEVGAFGDNSGSWAVQVFTSRHRPHNGAISSGIGRLEQLVIPECRPQSSLFTECHQVRQALIDYLHSTLGLGAVCLSLEAFGGGVVCEYIEGLLGIPERQRLNQLFTRLEQLARP